MPNEPKRLAIITGAASGLGRAFCRQLIAISCDWHIVVADIDEQGAQQTLSEIRGAGGATAELARLDVTDAAAWIELRTLLQRDWPRLDLLVNNAGICMSAEVGDGALDAWRRVLEVNYLGVLNGCHAMTPWLKNSAVRVRTSPNPVTPTPVPSSSEASATRLSSTSSDPEPVEASSPKSEGSALLRSPAIINVASIMAFVPAPALGAYCASKAAVVALSEAMYAELRPCGVHVTVVAPGFFRTRLLENGAFAARAHRNHAEKLVRGAKIDADFVAHEALRGAARSQLYVVPGRRARWVWRWKRSAPVSLLNLMARRYVRMMHQNTVGGDKDG